MGTVGQEMQDVSRDGARDAGIVSRKLSAFAVPDPAHQLPCRFGQLTNPNKNAACRGINIGRRRPPNEHKNPRATHPIGEAGFHKYYKSNSLGIILARSRSPKSPIQPDSQDTCNAVYIQDCREWKSRPPTATRVFQCRWGSTGASITQSRNHRRSAPLRRGRRG